VSTCVTVDLVSLEFILMNLREETTRKTSLVCRVWPAMAVSGVLAQNKPKTWPEQAVSTGRGPQEPERGASETLGMASSYTCKSRQLNGKGIGVLHSLRGGMLTHILKTQNARIPEWHTQRGNDETHQ
jgi:hypothetical protein